MFEKEPIPDSDDLFHRVPGNLLQTQNGRLAPNLFRDPKGNGMSTDWSKYSTPERCRLAIGEVKALACGVVTLPVGTVRSIDGLTVEHSPVDTETIVNQAHSHILGLSLTDEELKTKQRSELYEACGRKWTIEPGSQVHLEPKPPVSGS